MKILLITSLFPNNVFPDFGNFIFQRAAATSRLKANCLVVIAPVPFCPVWIRKKRWAVFRKIVRWETRDGIEVYHPRYPLFPKIAMPFHGLLILLGILRLAKKLHQKHAFDLIDTHFIFPDSLAAVIIGKFLRIPVVASARGSDINQFSRFLSIKPQIRYVLKNSDRLVSVCQALADEMVSLGVLYDKIQVVPNGIDPERFQLINRLKARRDLGINACGKMIVTVGALIPRKGHELLIGAMPKIIKIFPDTALYIIGGGSEEGKLDALIQKSGLAGRVILMGTMPNSKLCLWYNAADVFCLASSREGWANVVMEALACGTPAVATNVYGTPEIINSEQVGILVERTTESLAKGLTEALDKTWDRQAIRAHVAGRSWDVVGREVNDVFLNAISKHRSKSNCAE